MCIFDREYVACENEDVEEEEEEEKPLFTMGRKGVPGEQEGVFMGGPAPEGMSLSERIKWSGEQMEIAKKYYAK